MPRKRTQKSTRGIPPAAPQPEISHERISLMCMQRLDRAREIPWVFSTLLVCHVCGTRSDVVTCTDEILSYARGCAFVGLSNEYTGVGTAMPWMTLCRSEVDSVVRSLESVPGLTVCTLDLVRIFRSRLLDFLISIAAVYSAVAFEALTFARADARKVRDALSEFAAKHPARTDRVALDFTAGLRTRLEFTETWIRVCGDYHAGFDAVLCRFERMRYPLEGDPPDSPCRMCVSPYRCQADTALPEDPAPDGVDCCQADTASPEEPVPDGCIK